MVLPDPLSWASDFISRERVDFLVRWQSTEVGVDGETIGAGIGVDAGVEPGALNNEDFTDCQLRWEVVMLGKHEV